MLQVIKFFISCLQYVVPETSRNSLWKQFWDNFKTDDEGIFVTDYLKLRMPGDIMNFFCI